MPDDRFLAMTFSRPQYIPISLGILPAAWTRYRDDLRVLAQRHPLLFNQWNSPSQTHWDYDNCVQDRYRAGTSTDAWNCVWSNISAGHHAIVTRHPVPTRQAVRTLQPPTENDGLPHGLMYLRLADLRGFEEIMTDFAEEPPELQRLIDIVLQHNLRQVALHLGNLKKDGKTGEIVYFGDDLGMQTSLPMGPEKWRRYLKPCFQAIFAPLVNAGHFVYLHTDGHIHEIIPDLIDCRIKVLNPQYRANGLDHLVRTCKGKVCVDLDLDRQLMPFASPAQLDAHVRACVEALGSPAGGLWLKCEIDDAVPLENIDALCTAMEKYRAYFTR